jgi:hypothetical protein
LNTKLLHGTYLVLETLEDGLRNKRK